MRSFWLWAVVVALPVGAQTIRVTGGVTDYQVFQRGQDAASVTARGTASSELEGKPVDVVVVTSGQRRHKFHIPGPAIRSGEWAAPLDRIPQGGPYDITFTVRGTPASATVKHVLVGDLWVLAGQSNMEGVGDLEDLEPPDDRVNSFNLRDEWDVARDPLHSLWDAVDRVHWRRVNGEPRRVEGEQRDKLVRERRKGAGLGLPFAVEMVKRTGVPIGLVPCAHGGTSMDQWSPALKDQGGDSLYGAMLRRIRALGGKVAGVLWYQGESDSSPQAAPEFLDKFQKLVASLREDLGQPSLPFYYVQIGRFVSDSNPAAWNQVQVAQWRAEASIGRGGMVASVDAALDDGIHVSTQDHKRLGRRLANLACHDLFPALAGCTELKRGPRPESAKFEQGIIRLKFSGVNGKLGADGRIWGFSIVDASGRAVPLIYKVRVDPADGSTLLLAIGGKLPQPATLWYGAGKDPYANLKDSADMAAPVFSIAVE